MQSIKINIARDFSPTPGPRYIHEGNNSGELFRKEILYPKVLEALEIRNFFFGRIIRWFNKNS